MGGVGEVQGAVTDTPTSFLRLSSFQVILHAAAKLIFVNLE